MNSHLRIFSHLFKQEGTARDKRYLPALHPRNLIIDDRQLKDLLLYIQRFSGHLLFIPAGKEEEEGSAKKQQPATWKDFLQNDIALLLANIAACPVQEIGQAYVALQKEFDRERRASTFNLLMDHAFSVFEKLDKWYERAAMESAESKLKTDLGLYIQSYLAKRLADLRQIRLHSRSLLEGEHVQAGEEYFSRKTNPIWGDPDAVDRSFGERVFIGRDDEEKLINASLRLKEIFDTAFHVMEQVVSNCNSYLEETLHAKKDHQPHIALLITFLELYGYARNLINKIPQKHLDFYYEQVLGIQPRKAVADSVFVNIELEKGFDACELKKGAWLSAGKDAINKELVYETARDLVVRKARVDALRTLYIEKDKHNQVLGYHTETRGLPAEEGLQELSLQPFGNSAGAAGTRIGFAIASAQFHLAKGERNVNLRFELEKDIPVSQFDTSILELSLTGEKGWIYSGESMDNIRINRVNRTGELMLELDFTIPIALPSAIIAFNKDIHDGDFDTDLPILRCLLKYPSSARNGEDKELSVYRNTIIQLNSLQKIRPVNTIVTVQVGNLDGAAIFDGVRDLTLQNHEAILDPKKPFLPFTSLPKVGSSFYIGCNDFSYKPIQRCSLNLEWMLPDHFRSYYDKYMPPYDSNKFRASLSILQKKKWRRIQDVSIIDADSNDPRWRSIKVDLRQVKGDEEEEGQPGTSRFDVSKMDGMLKLKLNYPDFGHGIYSQLITSSVMEKASSGPAMPDFHKMIKRILGDAKFSIKLPPDPGDRNGSFKIVLYEILESSLEDEKARSMMIKGLGGMIRYLNEVYVRIEPSGTAAQQGPAAEQADQRTVVNDGGFVEWILRKLRVTGSTVSHDKDKESLGDVMDEIKEKILPAADFMLSRKKELEGITRNVIDSTIDQAAVRVVDRILALRKEGVSGNSVATILREEFEEANKLINDMIAKKIATVLMAGEIPPAPYTPVINMISVNYLSSRTCNEEEDRFFRISPFGHAAIGVGDALFDEANLKQPAGLLFVGIREWEPGQEISLLFRFAEGTGRTDRTPPEIFWKYLVDNEWLGLPDECLVSDSTYGLQTTGIVEFSQPADANNKNSLFDVRGLYWLCASVMGDTDGFPDLAGLASNAVLVCFRDQGNDPCHTALPLPEGRITKLVDKLPAIKKIQQPVASFHGRMKEEQGEFYTRVSERLRHKSRAVNGWDYERLVLEHFPGVFKVKCLNNYLDGRWAPGHVTVVPVCDLRNRENTGVDMLVPRASYTVLREIEAFLALRTSAFVKVHGINPHLSHVLIRCRVKFKKGVDKGFALQTLGKDLMDLLTPWADSVSKLSFSAKIYASNVISFIDKRDYVDYVEKMEMLQYSEDENGEKIFCRASNQDISLVETQFINGHTLLVSAPAHELELVE